MKKLLYVGEPHFLHTGYGVYCKEVLSRLYDTGKYDITEMGNWGEFNDKRATAPWKFIGSFPRALRDGNIDPRTTEEKQEYDAYAADGANQFGKQKFDDTVLALKPDIVFNILDVWMFEYILKSPYRPYFHFAVMPTVDSRPVNPDWVMKYKEADAVFSYTDWGVETLKECSGDLLNLTGVAIPGTNPAHFRPILNKREHKKAMGLDPDKFYVGAVMRNQKRKLFDDLFQAFRQFLDQNPDLAPKTLLYLHTSFPDSGWNFPTLLKENGLSSKVVFSYICQACNQYAPSYFADSLAHCTRCNNQASHMPNTKHGVDSETLGRVMNSFDCMVQYSLAESPGMPQAECGATGTYVFSVDYSGMADVISKLECGAIDVERFFRESETHRYFALPSNEDFVAKLAAFLRLPDSVKARMGFNIHKKTLANFDWDKTAKVWENHFDSVDNKVDWNSPPKIFNPTRQFPSNCSNYDFVKYCFANVLGQPERFATYFGAKMLQDLNNRVTPEFMGGFYIADQSLLGSADRTKKFERPELVQYLTSLRDSMNKAEAKRCGLVPFPKPYWV